MDAELFANTFPRLFHMAHSDSWDGIQRHGLLSTTALLDLFEIGGKQRMEIEATIRKSSIRITHPKHGVAVIRDQKPLMSDKKVASALGDSATPEQWYRLLNTKAYFWVLPERLQRLRNAVEYRAEPQLVLTFDTKRILSAHADKIWLCPMNSGACKPFAHPRTPAIFQRLVDYDFEFWRKKRSSAQKAVVECTIEYMLPNVEDYLIKKENLDAFS